MKNFLTEWNKFLKEGNPIPPKKQTQAVKQTDQKKQSVAGKATKPAKKMSTESTKTFTVADVTTAINKYKGRFIDGVDFSIFLDKMARLESSSKIKYDPYAENGQFLGAFQVGQDFYKNDKNMAYDPDKVAEALFNFFSDRVPGLYKANPNLKSVVMKPEFGKLLFFYLIHQQGPSGAVRIIYAADGRESELEKKVLDSETLARMRNQEVPEINKVLDSKVSNQDKAKTFINYFKNKYKLY